MSKSRLLVVCVAIGVLAFSLFGDSAEAQTALGNTPVPSPQTQGADIDSNTLRAQSSAPTPLISIPNDLDGRITKDENKLMKAYKAQGAGYQEEVSRCTSIPDAKACRSVYSSAMHVSITDGSWVGQHGYTQLIKQYATSAAKRSCFLGNTSGCWEWGKLAYKNLQLGEARSAWSAGACVGNVDCQKSLKVLDVEIRAKAGDIDAEVEIGRQRDTYYNPVGEPDFVKAFQYVQLAAAQGSPTGKQLLEQSRADADERAQEYVAGREAHKQAVLNGINAGLGAVSDAVAAQNAQQDARNAELNRQAAELTANNEQRRATEAEQQRRAAAQAQARSREVHAPATPTFVASTGTVAPPNCVYLSPSQPCVPLAQYQQMQAQHKASGNGICPASGFVPGVMMRPTSDVAVGVPCKPGTPYGPLIATTASGGYTGVTPPDPASAGPSGSGSGGSDSGGPFDPNLNDCVGYFYKNDPVTGDHLILQNNCSVRAQVYFYASSQVHGGVAIDPGATDNTYAAHDQILAAGALSIYACPVDDTPRQADGTQAYNGVNNRFRCSQK